MDVPTILNVNTLGNKKSIKKGQGHVCPIHTHVVNKHIYNHTYRPEYTCSEENVVVNNDCNKCSGF